MRLRVAPEDVDDLEFSDWIARLRDEPGADEGAGAAPDEVFAEPGDAAGEPRDEAGTEDAAELTGDVTAEPAGDVTAEPAGDVTAEPAGDAAAGPGHDTAELADDIAAGPGDVSDDGLGWFGEDGLAYGAEHGPGDVAAACRGGHAAATPRAYAPAGPGELAAAVSRRAAARRGARAVIGNEIRIPAVWCELAPCISRYGDPAALGEADIRARAISAGWRTDRFGRLTCPQCQQSSPLFWSAQPVALWDKETAIIMVTLMAEGRREGRAGNDADAAETAFIRPVQVPITMPGRHEIRGRHRKLPQRPADIAGAEDIAAMPIAGG